MNIFQAIKYRQQYKQKPKIFLENKYKNALGAILHCRKKQFIL